MRQEIVKIKSNDILFRESVLLCICSELYNKKVIIFFKTKKQCHRMAILFNLNNLKSCELHGIILNIRKSILKLKNLSIWWF